MFALTISWGKSPGDSLTIEHYPLCGVTYALTTIRRWAEFVRIVTAEILPRYHGVMVKSLGDGLLARFGVVPDAVDAAERCIGHLPRRTPASRRWPGATGSISTRAQMKLLIFWRSSRPGQLALPAVPPG